LKRTDFRKPFDRGLALFLAVFEKVFMFALENQNAKTAKTEEAMDRLQAASAENSTFSRKTTYRL
jgi:hypothetical protein